MEISIHPNVPLFTLFTLALSSNSINAGDVCDLRSNRICLASPQTMLMPCILFILHVLWLCLHPWPTTPKSSIASTIEQVGLFWLYFCSISGIEEVWVPALKASAEDTFGETLYARAGSCSLQSYWHSSWEPSWSSVARSLLGPGEGREGIPGPCISPRQRYNWFNFARPGEKWELALRNCWEKQTRFTHPQIGWTRAVTCGCMGNPQAFVMLGERRGWKLSPCEFALQDLDALHTLDTVEWDGVGWDGMRWRWSRKTLYPTYMNFNIVLIKKKILASEFHFTWVPRDQFCAISHLLSLSQGNIEILLHNLNEAELKKSAEDADWEVDPNHSSKLENMAFFLLCWHFATCLLMWTF